MRQLLVCLLFLIPASASAQLPGLLNDVLRNVVKPAPAQDAPAAPGPALLGETPLEEELAIGRQLAGHLLGAAPLAADEKLQHYVSRVGRWVASQGERADLPWRFGVLESQDLNAFALPGGYVFVTRGLVSVMRDEAELAGVLGHEIAHVNLKHHLKLYKQGQAISLVGSLIGQRSSQSAAAQALLGKGAEALARGLDKDAEFEADRAGVVLATRAGYAPYGLPRVLRALGQRNPREASLALLFKTHPLPQERLERLGEAIGDSLDRFEGQTLAARFKNLQ